MYTCMINIFILILLFLPICAFSKSLHVKLSDKIYNAYNKELKNKRNLYLVGSGGGMMHDIKEVFAAYVSFERLNVNEARKLYVEVVEGYLSKYNQDEKVRPYLHNFPFTVDNVDVKISFEDEKHHFRDQGYVALMFVGKHQRLVYRAYDPKSDEFIALYEEPYETAREIVMQESVQAR